jgi:hypothetical protein
MSAQPSPAQSDATPDEQLVMSSSRPGARTATKKMLSAIVVDETLPSGLAANCASILALTLGTLVRGLIGPDFIDADGDVHPGLTNVGVPILGAPGETLVEVRRRARREFNIDVIDFPALGQKSNDYEEIRGWIRDIPTADLEYVGLALFGPRDDVRKLTGNLPLLK